MAKKQADISIGKSAPPWMQTFADLMMQLLIFFVMLFALSAASVEEQLKEIKRRVDNYVESVKKQEYVKTKINEKGLVISLQNKVMFDSGKAEIFDEAKQILNNITKILIDYPNNVRIEGHTDNRPIHTAEFPSNWELSTARSTNMTRYLLEDLSFPPKRISSAGYAEYHPVVENDTPEHMALNRRVDIVVSRISLEQQKRLRMAKHDGRMRPFDDKEKHQKKKTEKK